MKGKRGMPGKEKNLVGVAADPEIGAATKMNQGNALAAAAGTETVLETETLEIETGSEIETKRETRIAPVIESLPRKLISPLTCRT